MEKLNSLEKKNSLDKMSISQISLNFTIINGQVVKIVAVNEHTGKINTVADQLVVSRPPHPKPHIPVDFVSALDKYIQKSFIKIN